MQHTFFVHFFAAVLHDYNVKLPETSQLHILCRKCRPCSRSLSFYCRSFSLFIGGPLTFLIFLPPLQNFRVVLPTTKKCLLRFLSLQISVALFLVELRWPVAYFLFFSFSCSVFQICGHEINLCLILQTTRIEKQFPLSVFFFIDSLCCLCITRRGWLCDSPPKQPGVAFGLPYMLIELFQIGMPVVRTGGRSVYGHMITKFSRMVRFTQLWCCTRARFAAPLLEFCCVSSIREPSQALAYAP